MEQKHATKEEETNFIHHYNHQNYTPELWAAKFGHRILCGDLRRYIFENKDFEQWVHELYRILHTGNLSLLRQNLLTAAEVERIEKEEEEDF